MLALMFYVFFIQAEPMPDELKSVVLLFPYDTLSVKSPSCVVELFLISVKFLYSFNVCIYSVPCIDLVYCLFIIGLFLCLAHYQHSLVPERRGDRNSWGG